MSSKRSEGEESEYPFFEGDGSSPNEWGDYGVAGDDYEGPPVFDDDQYEEESVPVYDTNIEDVIEEEEGFGDYGVAGDDYEGPSVFDDDQYEEESVPVYDTDIEDVIEEEEGFVGKRGFGWEEDNIKDVVIMVNDLCSSMTQTTLNVDFEEDINTYVRSDKIEIVADNVSYYEVSKVASSIRGVPNSKHSF
ncbi:hypothetical protein Tco_0439776 [Tanacetum coccineum]